MMNMMLKMLKWFPQLVFKSCKASCFMLFHVISCYFMLYIYMLFIYELWTSSLEFASFPTESTRLPAQAQRSSFIRAAGWDCPPAPAASSLEVATRI